MHYSVCLSFEFSNFCTFKKLLLTQLQSTSRCTILKTFWKALPHLETHLGLFRKLTEEFVFRYHFYVGFSKKPEKNTIDEESLRYRQQFPTQCVDIEKIQQKHSLNGKHATMKNRRKPKRNKV